MPTETLFLGKNNTSNANPMKLNQHMRKIMKWCLMSDLGAFHKVRHARSEGWAVVEVCQQ